MVKKTSKKKINRHGYRERRQASLQKKPVIPVTGKLGKAQKSKKKKIKKVGISSVDQYEDKLPDADRGKQHIREESDKINSTPKSLEQEIPFKLRELIRQKQQIASQSRLSNRKAKALQTERQNERRKKQEKLINVGMKRPVKRQPEFVRRPGETLPAYRRRVETESAEILKLSKYEIEHKCELIPNDKGDIEVKANKVTRKKQKLKEMRDKRKTKKIQKQEVATQKDFGDFQDVVSFGETNERPPELISKPKKAHSKQQKNEKLKSLKLMELLSQSSNLSMPIDPLKSMAHKHKMVAERQHAIDMYRSIKAKKQHGKTLT